MASNLSLQFLPDETIIGIFSFLDSRDLLLRLSLTCKRFYEIIYSVWYWRRRYQENYRGKAFLSSVTGVSRDEVEEMREMQRGGVHGDFVRRACQFESKHMHLEVLQASSGGLDCVHIVHPDISGTNTMVAAGSRDQRIYLWKKRDTQQSSPSSSSRSMRQYLRSELYGTTGHKGWVWCLATCPDAPNVLCSGGWDHELCIWDLRIQDLMFKISRKHKAAILGVAFPEPSLILTSSSDKLVRSFDIREKQNDKSGERAYSDTSNIIGDHAKAALCLVANGHYVYSGSEDKTLRLWDRRKPKEVVSKSKYESSVTDICFNDGFLSISTGTVVHFIDKDHTPISSYQTEHVNQLTSVYHNLGMLVTGSKDKSAMIHSMSQPHLCLKTIDHLQDVTDVHFSRGSLAISSSDRTVSLWSPKKQTVASS